MNPNDKIYDYFADQLAIFFGEVEERKIAVNEIASKLAQLHIDARKEMGADDLVDDPFGDRMQKFSKYLDNKRTDNPQIISFGIPEIDAFFNGGLPEGKIFTVGARMGTGKTMFSNLFARSAWNNGHKIAVFSVDNDPDLQMCQFLSTFTGVNSMDFANGSFFSDRKIRSEKGDISMAMAHEITNVMFHDLVKEFDNNLPLFYFSPNFDISHILILMDFLYERGVRVFVFDYIQKMKDTKGLDKTAKEMIENSLELLVEFTRLKKCFCLFLSQMVRDKEVSGLEALSSADGIGAAMDAVMTVVRNCWNIDSLKYEIENEMPDASDKAKGKRLLELKMEKLGEIKDYELHIVKNRFGELGKITIKPNPYRYVWEKA